MLWGIRESFIVYSGLFCHLDDPCMQKPCGNGSECIPDTASGEFSCNCMKGTTGQNCTTDINECLEVPSFSFTVKFEIGRQAATDERNEEQKIYFKNKKYLYFPTFLKYFFYY